MGFQKLDDLAEDLHRQARTSFNQCLTRFQSLVQRLELQQPKKVIAAKQGEFNYLNSALVKNFRLRLHQKKDRLDVLNARLRLLSPENVLSRGYSITTDAKSGEVIQSAKRVSKGQHLHTRLKDGEVDSVVEK
jgi:exodeoxyribonuclease VII large subunit